MSRGLPSGGVAARTYVMSESSAGGISDEQLPEDLQPGEDNPLAEPLDPEDEATKSREELEMDATQEDDESAEAEGTDAS